MGVFLSVILWAWVLTVGAKNIEPRFDGKKITNDVFLKSGRDKMDFYLLYKNNLESIH